MRRSIASTVALLAVLTRGEIRRNDLDARQDQLPGLPDDSGDPGPPFISTIPSSIYPEISPSSIITPPSTSASGSSTPPAATSSLPSSPATSISTATCGGQTVNVPNASLDWWYNNTLYDVVSTLSAQFASNSSLTGWTVLPATTTFDITSALGSSLCSSTLVFNTQVNRSLYSVNCESPPTPVAAQTIVITQTAYSEPSATTGSSIPNVVVTPAPASITIPSATGSFGEGTAFVYFSSFEVVTKVPISSGSIDCATETNAYALATPYSFAYEGTTASGSDATTGNIDPALLAIVNATNAVAGSWVAAPTVAIVVQKVFAAQLQPTQVPVTQISASQLQTVTPMMPQWLTPVGPPPTLPPFPPNPPHRETSAHSLQLPPPGPPTSPTTPNPPEPTRTAVPPPPPPPPHTTTTTHAPPLPLPPSHHTVNTIVAPFVGMKGSSHITLEVSVPETQQVVTAKYTGGIITATREPQPAGHGNGPDVTPLISYILGAATPSPTNALQVFSEALETMTGLDSTSRQDGSNTSPTTRVSSLTLSATSSTAEESRSGSSIVRIAANSTTTAPSSPPSTLPYQNDATSVVGRMSTWNVLITIFGFLWFGA